ncbi:MAG TPA: ABC transporter permease [Thermohalobaculum sp.]|nr:ABC transporter permease [Thermohalobaculum sp.]
MIELEPRPQPSRALMWLSPVIAIGLTLAAGGALMAAMGRAPGQALHVYFFQPFEELWLWLTLPADEAAMWIYTPAEVVVKAIPLALIGAGLAVCFRANVWNIGAAGQYTLGAIAGGWVALSAPADASGIWLVPYLAAGALAGMAWAAIPAFLRVRFNANEILVSLMLTYVAALVLDWLVRGPLKDPAGYGFPESRDFDAAFIMPVLVEGTRLHLGLVLAVAACIALWLMMGRTLKGFEVRVMGAAPRAGAFAGFSRNRTIWFVLLLSGGLAGLAGAIEVSATIQQLQPTISAEYGFVAIIVAFLGRLNPLGAMFGALILGVSFIGGENAQIALKLPKAVTGIFQGMLLFFLLGCDTLIRYRVRLALPARA